MRKAASRAAALALGALLCAPLQAQVLYKWIDAQGRVQYSDRLPKDFKGEVTRIERDIAPTPNPAAATAPPPAAPARNAEAEAAAKEPPQDMATGRRTTRNALDARLQKARANLENARKALENPPEPEPDERQIIQQRMQAGQGGMHGQSQQRSNCRATKDVDGKGVVICPVSAPNEKYLDRMTKLEDAVKAAEEELAEAQEARRRGVD